MGGNKTGVTASRPKCPHLPSPLMGTPGSLYLPPGLFLTPARSSPCLPGPASVFLFPEQRGGSCLPRELLHSERATYKQRYDIMALMTTPACTQHLSPRSQGPLQTQVLSGPEVSLSSQAPAIRKDPNFSMKVAR